MDALIALAIKNKQTRTSPLSGMLGYLIKRQIIAIRGKQTVSFRRGNGKHGQTSKYFCDATPRRPLIRRTCFLYSNPAHDGTEGIPPAATHSQHLIVSLKASQKRNQQAFREACSAFSILRTTASLSPFSDRLIHRRRYLLSPLKQRIISHGFHRFHNL